LAIAVQIIAIFDEIGKSERVVTAVVLVVASIQIVLTRPRSGSGSKGSSSVPEVATPATKDDAGSVSASDPP
jgi:hypothetical protein